MLETRYERHELRLERDFTISRGSTETTSYFSVYVDDGEHLGVGGGTPSEYYGETADSVEESLVELLGTVERVGDPHRLERLEREGGEKAARAAVSVALHDLVAKRLGVPLYRYWGLEPETPDTSFTVGIDTVEGVRERTRDAVERGFGVLKLKLGAENDIELVEAVRDEAPEATLRVDANAAWKADEAVEKIDALASLGVEFVEQPIPPSGDADYVYDNSALPVALDEHCAVAEDVPRVASHADIVNVKLMKSGGLREAIRTVNVARAHGLDVMIGCMVESNASIAAAVHLAPLADYADLDGSLLLGDDPFDGVPFSDGRFELGGRDGRAGTGATRR